MEQGKETVLSSIIHLRHIVILFNVCGNLQMVQSWDGEKGSSKGPCGLDFWKINPSTLYSVLCAPYSMQTEQLGPMQPGPGSQPVPYINQIWLKL